MLILNHIGNLPPKKNLKKKCYSPLVTPTKGTTMLNDPVLLTDWHVVAYAPNLTADKPMAVRLMKPDSVSVFPRTRHKNHLPRPVSKPTGRVRNITGSGFVWVIQHRIFRPLLSGTIRRSVKSTAVPITSMPVDRAPWRIFWM